MAPDRHVWPITLAGVLGILEIRLELLDCRDERRVQCIELGAGFDGGDRNGLRRPEILPLAGTCPVRNSCQRASRQSAPSARMAAWMHITPVRPSCSRSSQLGG